MAQTGARVSEAIDLRWREVSLTNRTALLLKTKTERNSLRHLTDILVARLQKLGVDRGLDDRVFHYTSRYSVNERIWAICDRAGIEYKSSHVCGRHTFFTTAFDLGLDIKTIMEAGGIKTVSLFMNTYVAPRANHGRMTADRLNGLCYGME
jgi:integrase